MGSELTQIPGDPKCHRGPPVRAGHHGGQLISGGLAQAPLTWVQWVRRPFLCPPTAQVQNASLEYTCSAAGGIPHWFPDQWREGCYGGKDQVEATGAGSTWENSEPKK